MTRFTLYGLLQYDDTLFADVQLPEPLNKDILIDEIIERSGDLYCYYQVPAKVKADITNWFLMKYDDFDRMYKALFADYVAIHNYDMTEDETITPDLTSHDIGSNQNASDGNGSTNINKASFDSPNFVPDNENISSTHNSNAGSYNNSHMETGNTHRTNRKFGNLGVTTSQQMIQSELELRKFNLYEYIAAQFEDKFLIQLY